MAGMMKKLSNDAACVFTGKSVTFGGSLMRPEATGYGTVYFAEEMAKTRDESLEGKTCLVSGSGNVAQYTVEKLLDLGAKPVSLSDSGGFIYDKDGIDREKLAWVIDLKERRRGRIMQYAEQYPGATFTPVDPGRSTNPLWAIPAEAAFPSATHNEITDDDARVLLENGCYIVAEGANMPTEPMAIERFVDGKILYGPGKAANAGGVAVSGLEMSQNAERRSWTRETVDERLHTIMVAIHTNCRDTADEYDVPGNYVHGANIAGFRKVADAMLAQGVV
jgi:glutamate dehydrogenase (NADP+)